MIVASVLKTGGRYNRDWVERLYRSVARYSPDGTRFVCLSDDPSVPGAIPLRHDWPGWWSKIELFTPGLFSELVVYFDLDTIIRGDISVFADMPFAFGALRDFYRPRGLGSGVMAWMPSPETERVYLDYAANPRDMVGGDQTLIEHFFPNAARLQTVYPGLIASWKADRPTSDSGANVVCFHGEPKQDNCGSWAQLLWELA